MAAGTGLAILCSGVGKGAFPRKSGNAETLKSRARREPGWKSKQAVKWRKNKGRQNEKGNCLRKHMEIEFA